MSPQLQRAAEALRQRAIETIGADRKTNTVRRSRMAGNAIERAEKDRALAEAALRCHEAGGALARVTSIAQLRTLDKLVARGRSKAPRASWQRYEDIADEDAVAHAELPRMRAYGHVLKSLSMDVEPISKSVANELWRFRDADHAVDLEEHPTLVECLLQPQLAKVLPWQLKDDVLEKRHMAELGITTREELRETLAAFVALKGGAPVDPTAKRRRELEAQLVGAKIPGYFPTPRPIVVEKMVARVPLYPGWRVLEPSAGRGDIAEVARERGCYVETCEINFTLREILQLKGFRCHDNFLTFDGEDFDAVLMNPPFEDGQDMAHVRRAFTMLRPGGWLAAIMSEGTFFREDRQARAFREWLEERGGTSEKLPAGTFDRSDVTQRTGVATRIVVIRA